MRRTKEEAEQTQRIIVDAAFRVFQRKGYAATTMNDIAEEIGMSRGVVYWHFKNKTELFTYLLNECLDSIFDDLKKIFSSSKPMREKIREMVLRKPSSSRFFELVKDFEPTGAVLDSKSRRSALKVIQERFLDLFDMLIAHLQSEQEKGNIRKSIDVKALGTAIFSVTALGHAPSSNKMDFKLMNMRNQYWPQIAAMLFDGFDSVFI